MKSGPYHYMQEIGSDPLTFIVGREDADGRFQPHSTHRSKDAAAERVAYLNGNDLAVAALVRIAEAVELVFQNVAQLTEDRDLWRSYAREQEDAMLTLERRVASLRGVITRMKKRGLV